MKLNIGDRVAYSVQFLKSIGMCHTDMAHAKGQVAALKSLGGELTLATITWEKNADMPEKVNVQNLAKVGPNMRYCQC